MIKSNLLEKEKPSALHNETSRTGVIVEPVTRLDYRLMQMIHEASVSILDDPGIICPNEEAASIFNDAGCSVSPSDKNNEWKIRIPEQVVKGALFSAPSRVILGARKKENMLILDSQVPRVYFGTGAETNVFLETEMHEFVSKSDKEKVIQQPVYRKERGNIKRLCDSARLCNALSHVDFFIRNVNIQDEEINEDNKDVNMFFASLMYMSKHVQAGLTSINSLDKVIQLGEIVAGGPDAFKQNPVLSFIACIIKSPLQMVDDTTQKVIEIARRRCPLVISSSPQGGSTAPIQEEGMTAMINAEILAGITLTQIVNPGTPVIYGAVPVRARLDTLHDLYGAPEFIQYNIDCVQMARYYSIPCYSTAGVGDSKIPGMQATVEKMFSHLAIAQSGAQYIHYAFGLLDRTNVFSPVQAIIDNANIGMVKHIVRKPIFEKDAVLNSVEEIKKVMNSSTGLFARFIRKQMRRGVVSEPYPLEGKANTSVEYDQLIGNACAALEKIRAESGEPLSEEIVTSVYDKVSDILPFQKFQL